MNDRLLANADGQSVKNSRSQIAFSYQLRDNYLHLDPSSSPISCALHSHCDSLWVGQEAELV